MSELDLDAIQARERTARDAMTEDWQDNNQVLDAVSASMYDVAPLVDEVRRLRDAVQRVREWVKEDGESALVFKVSIRRALDGGDPSGMSADPLRDQIAEALERSTPPLILHDFHRVALMGRLADAVQPILRAAVEQARVETAAVLRSERTEGRLMSLRGLRHWAGTHQPDNTALLDRIDQQTTLAENDLRALDDPATLRHLARLRRQGGQQ